MIKLEHVKPQDIEKHSMLTIEKELADRGIILDKKNEKVIKRAIHTTADFDYAKSLKFSEDAVNVALNLIKEGADIVTDTNMALAGINKKELEKYGCRIHCFMADAEVADLAAKEGVTRAYVSMKKASLLDKKVIFAVGNAPTALIALREMYDKNEYVPSFIIGVPVGFVNVVASKELIMETDIPYIINEGNKGGSNVCAAIVNALLYMLRDTRG